MYTLMRLRSRFLSLAFGLLAAVASAAPGGWITTWSRSSSVPYPDPDNPDQMLPMYDSGDHLHPGNIGYLAMANAIDLSLFQ